jgi:hypothetical protein
MPQDTSIKSVLIIGSGPIIIGQAFEIELPFHKVAVFSQTGSKGLDFFHHKIFFSKNDGIKSQVFILKFV